MGTEQDSFPDFLPHFPDRRDFKYTLDPKQMEKLSQFAENAGLSLSETYRRVILAGSLVHYATTKGATIKIVREKGLSFFEPETTQPNPESEGLSIELRLKLGRKRLVTSSIGSEALVHIEDIANFHHRTVEEVFQECTKLGLEILEATLDKYSSVIVTRDKGEEEEITDFFGTFGN